jgi:hypothetical protein
VCNSTLIDEMKAPRKRARIAAEKGEPGRAASPGIISRELQERAERAARERKQASEAARRSQPVQR